MVSTVKVRPNHYELLGLTPAATHDEIKRAFAREISVLRPRAFGGAGEISIAYETLRNPARRKAYDASIGIRPEPKPIPAAIAGTVPAHFIGSTLGARLERLAREDFRPASPSITPKSRPERIAEPRTAAFIAASLRSPAKREAHNEPTAVVQRSPVEPLHRAEPEAPSAAARREVAVHPKPRPAPEHAFLDVEDGSFEWKRPAMLAGALVLTVGLIGAWAGWEAGNDSEAELLPKPTLTQKLPPAPEFPIAAEQPVSTAPNPVAARPEAPKRVIVTERAERSAPRPQYVALADDPVGSAQPDQGVETPEIEQAAAETGPIAAVPAKLPLPDRVVARTIGRIGYACGQVAGASAVDGQAGVFKVTCTSGHSYRAAPVRGRYRFSRWDKN
jgi:hypothetical protein